MARHRKPKVRRKRGGKVPLAVLKARAVKLNAHIRARELDGD